MREWRTGERNNAARMSAKKFNVVPLNLFIRRLISNLNSVHSYDSRTTFWCDTPDCLLPPLTLRFQSQILKSIPGVPLIFNPANLRLIADSRLNGLIKTSRLLCDTIQIDIHKGYPIFCNENSIMSINSSKNTITTIYTSFIFQHVRLEKTKKILKFYKS